MPSCTVHRNSLKPLSERFKTIVALRFWNTACAECAGTPPSMRIETNLTTTDANVAHGIVSQGSLTMLTDFVRKADAEAETKSVVDSVRAVVHAGDASDEITTFASKLADIYNMTSTFNTGTVAHLVVTDGPPIVMCLQCVYCGTDERA